MPCIYCGTPWSGSRHRAHIFPVAIFGEHEYLHLEKGEVCARCNNRTAKLESDFKHSLGMLQVLHGAVLNRRGEPSRIERPGLVAVKDPADPWLFLNTSAKPGRGRDHTIVPPMRFDKEFVVSEPVRTSDGVRLTITQQMPITKKFRRVLAKIAFETLAFERGADLCCQARFNTLRDFIMKGKGHRAVVMPTKLSAGADGQWQLGRGIRILQLEPPGDLLALVGVDVPFAVDLSPDGRALGRVFETLPASAKSGFVLFGLPRQETPVPVLEFPGQEVRKAP